MPTGKKIEDMSTKSKQRTNWLEVWERKASEETGDLKKLNGHEKTSIDPQELASLISSKLNIQKSDRVLEVGAGAGMIAQYLDCNYVGTDYSKNMCDKHTDILGNKMFCCEANKLPFEDNQFDKVFAFSVFHYFPNQKYASEAAQEMLRVAKEAVFIGDLPLTSHDSDHLLYDKEQWSDWDILDGYFRDSRFNIFKGVV